MKDTLIVNLFGVPSAAKSTGAAYIFSKLKLLGVNAELVTEFAKDKVYEEDKEVFNNQAYIFGKQYFRISRVQGKVDVIVTDSPIINSLFYNSNELLGKEFEALVRKVFDSFNSLNYFVLRVKKYNPIGRFQTEEQSDALVTPMETMLNDFKVPYTKANGDIAGYDKIIDDIIKKLGAE